MFEYYEGFEQYSSPSPTVKVIRVSHDAVPTTHRFYDTSPISPSGRLIAFTEFERVDRLPNPGDEASVVVRDLTTGQDVFRQRTIAWDTQLGAQVQWGANDSELYFNQMNPQAWLPYAVKVNLESGEQNCLEGPVYMISPDGKNAISPDLKRIWLVQPGYGVIVPKEHNPAPIDAPEDDGLFVTDTDSGSMRLLVSTSRIYHAFREQMQGVDLGRGGFYGFHAKWSPNGERIMFILRWRDATSRRPTALNWIVTMKSDASDLRLALGPSRWSNGHHPNWCADSEHIVMNLPFPNRRIRFPRVSRFADRTARKLHLTTYPSAYSLRFAVFRHDGTDLHVVAPNQLGSGHPTWNDEMRSILTDSYPWEPVAAGDGTSPIRLVSIDRDCADTLVVARTRPDFTGPRQEWRVDPHPAWDHERKRFVFNGLDGGTRGVFIADMDDYSPSDR